MTEKYNIIYNRIINNKFNFEDFKKRERKEMEFFEFIDNQKNFSHFVYENPIVSQQYFFKLILEEILSNFMDIFYEDYYFPIIKDFKNNLDNYIFNINHYSMQNFYEPHKNINEDKIKDLCKNIFSNIYIENIKQIICKKNKYLTNLYTDDIREEYSKDNKEKLLLSNNEFIDIIGCFIKYAFIKKNKTSKEDVEEVKENLLKMSIQLMDFLCKSVKIIYFNNLFRENSKEININFYSNYIYINEEEANEINNLKNYFNYIIYEEDYYNDSKTKREIKGEKIQQSDDLNNLIKLMKEIEKNTKKIKNKLKKCNKFLQINNFIDYYHDIHIKNFKNNYKDFLEKILEKFDNIIKNFDDKYCNFFTKSNYYDLVEKKFILDEQNKISTMQYKLMLIKMNGLFNKENYTIKKINDTDFEFYVMDVYLSDFDYDEEAYDEWLEEQNEKYENDSYEAYIFEKGLKNTYGGNNKIPKNELDKEIKILIEKEEKFLEQLYDKLNNIIKIEKTSKRLEEMTKYYNLKYELNISYYKKLYKENDFKHLRVIEQLGLYKFNVMSFPETIDSFVCFYKNLFETN